MTTTRSNVTEQPMPTRSGRPAVQDRVIADIQQRKRVGVERYGTPLQTFNGRNAARDGYEEALDLVQYWRQLLDEWNAVQPVIEAAITWRQLRDRDLVGLTTEALVEAVDALLEARGEVPA